MVRKVMDQRKREEHGNGFEVQWIRTSARLFELRKEVQKLSVKLVHHPYCHHHCSHHHDCCRTGIRGTLYLQTHQGYKYRTDSLTQDVPAIVVPRILLSIRSCINLRCPLENGVWASTFAPCSINNCDTSRDPDAKSSGVLSRHPRTFTSASCASKSCVIA